MVKKKKIALIIFSHDYNSEEFLTEIISQVFGYHKTQAANCAHMISNRGSYIVKTFPRKEKKKAEAFYELIVKNDIPIKLSYV